MKTSTNITVLGAMLAGLALAAPAGAHPRLLGATPSGGGNQAATQADIHFRGDGTSDAANMDVVSREGYSVHLTLWPSNGRLTVEEDAGQRR